MASSERRTHLERFYTLLSKLEGRIGGRPRLGDCRGGDGCPDRGVYFFFESGEQRSTSGSEPRVVRVGTHAVSAGSKSRLWTRLRQHRGTLKGGGGNHRSSIFRRLVGTALQQRDGRPCRTWGRRRFDRTERAEEHPFEQVVSDYIRSMPLLWLGVDGEPSPRSARAWIERNAIALLSNRGSGTVDRHPPSEGWLGQHSPRVEVRQSGLWNIKHTADPYDPCFLDELELLVRATAPRRR